METIKCNISDCGFVDNGNCKIASGMAKTKGIGKAHYVTTIHHGHSKDNVQTINSIDCGISSENYSKQEIHQDCEKFRKFHPL